MYGLFTILGFKELDRSHVQIEATQCADDLNCKMQAVCSMWFGNTCMLTMSEKLTSA